MSWAPHITVACVIEKDGNFLIVEEESFGQGVYNQPAGHVEPGETLIAAAIRETREETGWQVKPTELLGLYVYSPPTTRSLITAPALSLKPSSTIQTKPWMMV